MKNKKKSLLFALSIMVIVFATGCSSSEYNSDTDPSTEKAEELMEEGKFDEAHSALSGAFEGKSAELKSALSQYNHAVSNFYNNYSIPILDDIVAAGYKTGFQETYDSFDEIDSVYKDYKPFKEKVKEWQEQLEDAIDYEEDLRDDYEDMKEYLEEKDYDKCIEMAEDWNQKIEENFSDEEIIKRLKAFTGNFTKKNIEYKQMQDS